MLWLFYLFTMIDVTCFQLIFFLFSKSECQIIIIAPLWVIWLWYFNFCIICKSNIFKPENCIQCTIPFNAPWVVKGKSALWKNNLPWWSWWLGKMLLWNVCLSHTLTNGTYKHVVYLCLTEIVNTIRLTHIAILKSKWSS